MTGERPPPSVDGSVASLAAVKARFPEARKGKVVPVDGTLWAAYSDAADLEKHWETEKRKYEAELREFIGEAADIEVDGEIVAHRLRYPVKEHVRKASVVDSIRRVKHKDDDD
jgi:hypothetical protein